MSNQLQITGGAKVTVEDYWKKVSGKPTKIAKDRRAVAVIYLLRLQ